MTYLMHVVIDGEWYAQWGWDCIDAIQRLILFWGDATTVVVLGCSQTIGI